MVRRSCTFLLAALCALWAGATHIVGGEMYYDHLGGNNYRIILNFYRDCGPDNTNGAVFDATVTLGVFNAAGVLVQSVTASDPGEVNVPVVLNDPCLAVPPQVCLATTQYIANVTLPPIAGGYDISYSRCCRTPSMINVANPNTQGLTCTVHIPGPPDAVNSSPRFTEYPPGALCLGQDVAFDHSATDPDGDQLTYELCAPFQGGDNFDPQPAPFPPPYTPIVWAAGYSTNFPMDGAPGIAIDPVTGEVTVHPTLQGSFTVGIMVKEFRNGVLLSEVRRDFKFVVVVCDIDITSTIGAQVDRCTGLTATFQNESINGQFWHWDFGDPSVTNDTSNVIEPTWTYADTGVYTVTLIANPGWPCADTMSMLYEAYLPLDPGFERPPIRCPGEPAAFTATGNFTPAGTVNWDMGVAGSPQAASGTSATASFSAVGAHPVLLTLSDHGCTDSYQDSVVVFPFPEVDFLSDRQACEGTPFQFTDNSVAWTTLQHDWDFGDGQGSSEQDPVHIYDNAGTYTVSLTIATDSGCIAERTMTVPGQVVVDPIPVAAFSALPNTVSVFTPHIEVVDYSQDAALWSYSIENNVIDEPDFDYSFDEAGRFTIIQTVTSEHGCVDTTSRVVYVTDHIFYAPNAFSPNGDGNNDTWAPVVRGARIFELVVFDRWGVERFRTTDPRAEWNGDGLEPGVFSYVARIAEHGSFRKEYVGHITLLR
ncbi:MAG: PKD domain-containing protein [Flavobacteriales bacterium]|nr:PKD domain-containing protein [Flavobacteriales bacterium]